MCRNVATPHSRTGNYRGRIPLVVRFGLGLSLVADAGALEDRVSDNFTIYFVLSKYTNRNYPVWL